MLHLILMTLFFMALPELIVIALIGMGILLDTVVCIIHRFFRT